MEIEAKLLNPGEARVEMKIVATLDEWREISGQLPEPGVMNYPHTRLTHGSTPSSRARM